MSQLKPIQSAVLHCYTAICDLVPRDLRRAVILIGGAATIAHGEPNRYTKDVDIIVSQPVLVILDEAISKGQGGFRKYSDGDITWDASTANGQHQFIVRVEFILLGGPFAPRVPSVVGFRNGFVATLPELVRNRCETLCGRGDERDYQDLRLLLTMSAKRGVKLPHIDEEEMLVLIDAVEMLEDDVYQIYFMDILSSFEKDGRRFGSFQEYLTPGIDT